MLKPLRATLACAFPPFPQKNAERMGHGGSVTQSTTAVCARARRAASQYLAGQLGWLRRD